MTSPHGPENPSTPNFHVHNIENLVGARISLVPPPSGPPPRGSWLARIKAILKSSAATAQALSLRFAAFDDPELIAKLKPYERNFASLRGGLQVGDFVLRAAGLAILLGYVSGSGLTASSVIGGIVLALYLVLADHLSFVRAPLLETGLHGMADAGLRVELPSLRRRSARFAKILRLVMTAITGAVLALVIGLKYDHAAIVQQEQLDWVANNRGGYEQAVRDFDGKQQRLEQAYRQDLASCITGASPSAAASNSTPNSGGSNMSWTPRRRANRTLSSGQSKPSRITSQGMTLSSAASRRSSSTCGRTRLRPCLSWRSMPPLSPSI